MKKNKMMRIAGALFVLALTSTCVISGTFAKYTTEVQAKDTAIVADWDVKAVLGSNSFGSAETVLNLFDESKVYDLKDTTDFTAAGTDDTDVRNAAASAAAIIAPGTWGKFTYTLKNDSDVNATYTVDYTVDEKNVPLKWSIDGTTWTDDLADVSTAVAINMPSTKGTPTTKDITVYWKWDFEGTGSQTDATDTALGTASTLGQPSISIKVTFVQVD